jgi:hypothetical protein
MTKNNSPSSVAVVKLSGGLGNQMFQYAFGLAYHLRHNVPVKFYTQDLIEKNEHNGLELEKVFNIHLNLATEQEVLNLPLVKEPSIGYHPNIANSEQIAYFCGWWSSEKYFSDYWSSIRKTFEWKNVYSSMPVAETLKQTNSCAIHFRRGDYIAPEGTMQIFCSLGERYYKKAIEYAIEKHGSKTFFVFSDDPVQAIEFFSALKRKLPRDIDIHFLINDKKEQSFVDMFLMTYCTVVIAANSSFSWWGAKLNINKDVPVVMPKSWYTNSVIKTADIYPARSVVL